MKSESPAKKHHFWILLGLVPLLTLIGVLMVSAKVGGKIDERQADIDKAKKDISSKTNPKPDQLIAQLDKVGTLVGKKQEDLHKENWERQKNLFTWPRNSAVFKALEDKKLKFGDPIPDLTAVFGAFQQTDTYQYEFSTIKKGTSGPGTGMADLMAPTQFAGGSWQRVLRYVNDFGQMAASKDQIWLILEDMWVQRSLLEGLRSVNTDLATFERVKYEQNGKVIDDPAKGAEVQNKMNRLFRSRNWELALELVPEGTSYKLTGTLTNVSERLQLMGNDNVMTLNVWLSSAPGAPAKVFKIGGEYLPGKGATKTIKDKDGNSIPANVLPIIPVGDAMVPAGTDLDKLEIARVEQVFDIRTVPIKRIDALVLGQLDSRNAATPTLLPPRTPPFTKEYVGDPSAETPADGTGSGPKGSPLGGDKGSGMGFPSPGGADGTGGSGFPGFPGLSGAGGATGLKAGGGPLVAVTDGNKKRYVAVTEQVRRMPVGLVVVVDQAYVQDVLLALSNSPLRFQITQVTWTRFRKSLDGIGGGSSGGSSGNGTDIDVGAGGKINFGGGDPDERGPRPPFGGGSSGGPPRLPGAVSGTGGTGLPSGFPGPGGYPGSGYPGSGYPSGGSSAVSESQITSGLVELSVYGIVSLYEKYEAPKPPDAAGASTPAPAPAPNAPTTPAPMDPAPPTNPVPPKMRRRTRA